MEGVLVYLVYGMILFTPIGFIAGYLEHQKDKKKELEEQENINKQINKN